MSFETDLRVRNAQTLCTFEELNDRFIAVDFQHAAQTAVTAIFFYFDQFVILDVLNVIDDHKRTDDFFDGSIFSVDIHVSLPPLTLRL